MRGLATQKLRQCSYGATNLLCHHVFIHCFSFFNYSVYVCYSNLFHQLLSVRNVSYFRVHFFIPCFYCLLWHLLSLVFQLSLSLCFSRRGCNTNLVSFVIFPLILLALFIFCFRWLPALCIYFVYVRFFSESLEKERISQRCGF